jgi:hypothetical protein
MHQYDVGKFSEGGPETFRLGAQVLFMAYVCEI